ncbi:MAG TPA: carboxypeptidase-like regulatory domain-containing protein [Myxococcaceae bacterium]|nr:carboxypeptidase-like regulatory domain-containing protein [Myxococcaceae bacterium]
MNGRAILRLLGPLLLLTAACGGGSDDPLALGAIPQSASVAAGDRVEVSLTLTRRETKGTTTLSATGVPAGLTATFEPAELSEDVHTSVLSIQAAPTATPGAHVIEVQATRGNHTATLELPVQVVTGSVSGTIQFQDGRPLTSAIVEVLGQGAVLVDAEGAFEIPEVTPPYDLRVSWPEQGSVHIYRGLEERHVELRPFADRDWADRRFSDFRATLTNWVPGSRFIPWIHAEDQPARIEWVTVPDATGYFYGGAVFQTPGEATLQGLTVSLDAEGRVQEYEGFLELSLVLDDEEPAEGLSAALSPIQSFTVNPNPSFEQPLSLSRACPVVEQPPHVAQMLICHAPEDALAPFPALPNGELSLLLEYANEDGGISRRVVRGISPENATPTITFAAPPVLESPVSGGYIDQTQSFLVSFEGDAPITLSLRRIGSEQEFHVTTREREIPFPDPGPFITRPEDSSWEWVVRALPEASGWEVLEDGGVLGIHARVDQGLFGGPLGAQPHTTRSEYRAVSVPW